MISILPSQIRSFTYLLWLQHYQTRAGRVQALPSDWYRESVL